MFCWVRVGGWSLHQANHSFRRNSQYTLYSAHPVLGNVMAIVAVKDLPAGSEVLCDYGYSKKLYDALNITFSDQECVKVTDHNVGQIGCKSNCVDVQWYCTNNSPPRNHHNLMFIGNIFICSTPFQFTTSDLVIRVFLFVEDIYFLLQGRCYEVGEMGS